MSSSMPRTTGGRVAGPAAGHQRRSLITRLLRIVSVVVVALAITLVAKTVLGGAERADADEIPRGVVELPQMVTPEQLGCLEFEFSGPAKRGTTFISRHQVTRDTYLCLGFLEEDSSASGLAYAEVSYQEAALWCQDYEALLRGQYPESFAAGGPLSGYNLVLPSSELFAAARSIVELKQGGVEWLRETRPVLALQQRVPTSADPMSAASRGVGFRFALVPQKWTLDG